ncbi:MAG: SpoIIE family protein phosphatase [Treponema sp.]|jgi:serine phosphatase RsbU (regulator of sigma subunit)/BMFP domain-containing protein YqiC|nr:SpoIIE family protein phosphatase [Treponema sp.]
MKRPSYIWIAALFVFLSPGLPALSDFYWEEPEVFSSGSGCFPVSAFSGGFSVIAWQELEANQDPQIAGDGFINISLAVRNSGEPWQLRRSVGGRYAYSGTVPSILSIALDKKGRILIAAAASTTQTEILISEDWGETFSRYRVDAGSESSVAPRIFVRSDGGYLLFVTRGYEESLSIYYARSDDGASWSPFELFVKNTDLQLNFLPTHGSLGSTDYVIFQSFVGSADVIPAFQLFLMTSADGGITWTPPRRFTGFQDPVMNTSAGPERFDNQRPHLSVYENNLFLVWERRFGTGSPQIYGVLVGPAGNMAGPVERINSEEAYCNNPVAFIYEQVPTVVWFDNRRGNDRVFLAQRSGMSWQNYDISGSSGDASFARPAVGSDGLFVFWQTRARGSDRIISLAPDTSVIAPRLTPRNFTPSRRSRSERVQVSWNVPPDPSGIMGFSWNWSQSETDEPPREILFYNTGNAASQNMELIAPEDGSWFFTLIAQDFAGNWSRPAGLEFIRDTTPPAAAAVIPPELDGRGYLTSNTFSLAWEPPPDPDIAGYTWVLQYVGGPEQAAGLDNDEFIAAAETLSASPARLTPWIMGGDTSVSYTNQDDGIWRFSVSAIDEVGNIGPQTSIFFRTDKYIPHTYVTYVDSSQDEQGLLSVRIMGRGFSNGGNVQRIFLDRDGTPPYDREFSLTRGDFRVLSDREITGLRVEDMEEGLYRLGLVHPLRGLYLTDPLVGVDKTGTVKFGDYSRIWEPSWLIREGRRFVFDFSLLFVIVILVFCAVGFIASIRGIGNAVAESAAVKIEAVALITGDFMPSEKKKRLVKIKKRGGGLRLKLASFTIVLVLLVVVMVSAPLYLMMTRTQRETLLQGLWDRSTVLLEGLATSARAYLPSGVVLELGFLPAQSAAVPEARYVTITGYSTGSTIYGDHVWATNDPDILSKIDTAELAPGVSRLTDVLSPRLEEISRELNERARAEVGDISRTITELTREGVSIATRLDAASRQRLADIQVTTRSLEARLTESLSNISRQIGSEPAFSTATLARDGSSTYIFFKPVMYRQGAEDNYFRGLIRLEVSIDSIIAEITHGQRDLLRVILIVALAAITIGAIGALVLSSLIIRPIRKLVTHVERIRDTEDKAKLEGMDINIRSQDEIAVLGNTINDMTHGLVKAALASQDLSIGKEIQKKFIPLELDREGNKLSSGYKDTKNAHFFGYYEGAKGVSGDYFDYQDLDGRYYAVIKCDVAGKGIPAALIMIQVATMFLNYFKQWKPTAKGMHIEEVVYQINDFIETLGFKGRFAAFTLCLFDSQTGIVRFCNAGDNIIHLFDASEGRVKTMTLPETPATGVLPNFLVESKGGYTVQTLTIDHGDILLLYTDGIEEAKRKFRDAEFKEILCTEGGAPNDTPHGNHVVGQGDEEMGPDRVQEIINAVMNKNVYTLYKYHNPEGEVELKFDFSECDGKVEEVIMAMVSVEKMFRCYKNPKADDDARVLVDKKVDEFLKKHFLQYRNYCSYTREYPGSDAYMYYTRVREDDQYDDLTILGIKRK